MGESSVRSASRMHAQRYAAFISYRHLARDRHWAMRIMRELEAFRTPRALQQEGFPDRIGTIFRDEDEIPASTDLSDNILDALAHSDFLIVICTPDTPNSRWVRREIEQFHELGRGDKVIPVLVDGNQEISFPPELRMRRREVPQPDGTTKVVWDEIEPIAADVRPREDESRTVTERRAMTRLAAALLGCRFDELARRKEHQQRAKWRNIAAATLVTLAAALSAGYWHWDNNIRTKTSYFANYGERWGVPFGIGPMDEGAARAQGFVYRLTTRGGRVVGMQQQNGSGGLVGEVETADADEPWTRDVARFVYAYRDDGTLASVAMFDTKGHLLRQHGYEFDKDRLSGVVSFARALGMAERQRATGSALGSVRSEGKGAIPSARQSVSIA